MKKAYPSFDTNLKVNWYCSIILAIFCNICLIPATFAEKRDVNFARDNVTIQTTNNQYNYHTEIATSKEQLELGLMNRTNLEKDSAMLFIFSDNKKINMWMKDTLIPLDMLFIDKHGKIIYIAHNNTPESLDIISAGDAPVMAVLEITGGTAKMKNINVGDKIIYKVFKQ